MKQTTHFVYYYMEYMDSHVISRGKNQVEKAFI